MYIRPALQTNLAWLRLGKVINFYMKDLQGSNKSFTDGSTLRQGAEEVEQAPSNKASKLISSRLEQCTSYVFLSHDGCMMACSRANDLQTSGQPISPWLDTMDQLAVRVTDVNS